MRTEQPLAVKWCSFRVVGISAVLSKFLDGLRAMQDKGLLN